MKKIGKYIIIAFVILSMMISVCFIPISATKLIPLVENQIKEELGLKVHIERLILRVGPCIKLKAPVVHVLFEDGHKFAQIDNAKFYVSLASLIKQNPRIFSIKARRLMLRVASDNEALKSLIKKMQEKSFEDAPNVYLKEYNFSYLNKSNNDKYNLSGQLLNLEKNTSYKTYKVKTNGALSINNNKYIGYDVVFVPNIEIAKLNLNSDFSEYIEQIRDLDFHSDIIADVKLYRNQEKQVLASGFINVDNISVLDKAKKNPKSFIYLTLWGDKASILSNIYTSINKKVYIEGMIKNSQNPVLDLKVKTDEIEIKDLYQKLKIFFDFSQFKNVESITGTLNANFNLKGDFKKIKSNGYIKVSNAKIKANGLDIDRINSEIDLSNNIVNIIKAVGYVNNSPIIAKGRIDKSVDIEVLMNKVELKHLCPKSWSVNNGIVSLIAHITGTLDQIKHKEKISIENLNLSKNNFELTVGSYNIDTNKSNTAYLKDLHCKNSELEDIKIPSMNMIINSDFIKIPDFNIYMPNSMLTTKADILNYSNKPNFIVTIDGYINSKDIKRFANNSTRYPVKLIVNGDKENQICNAQVLLEKTDIFEEPMILNVSSKIEKNNIKIEDLSLVAYSGKFTSDLKGNSKGAKKIIVTGLLEGLKTPIMKNIRVFIPQQLNLKICDTIAQIKGDIFLNGEFIKPEVVGQLLVQNLFNQSLQLSLNNCTLDFNKNNIILNSPVLKLADSAISLNALISTDFSKSIIIKNANIKSKYFNLDTVLMYKDSPIIKLYPVIVQEGKFYAEKFLMSVYNNALYLSALTSDFKLENSIISLKNISAEMYNGKISSDLNYNLRDEQFASKILARGVSAEPIFNIISTRKDSINGVMNFDADLKGELSSKQSLKGNIKFVINNGRMSTLGKLEHLLYAQNVIADNMLRTSLSVVTKAITLKDTGLFKDLRGEIDLEQGIANIKFLQSQGPLMSLFIKGQYNTLNDYANLVILGRLSDEIISGLGAFGDFSFNKLMVMLTGEEQKQNITVEDFEKIPQLPMKNTKEFRSIINGIIDKPSSVKMFNWISYSQKTLKQKEVPMTETKLPDFVNNLPD